MPTTHPKPPAGSRPAWLGALPLLCSDGSRRIAQRKLGPRADPSFATLSCRHSRLRTGSACALLLLYALHEDAADFYASLGFRPSPTDPRHLYFLLNDARASLGT